MYSYKLDDVYATQLLRSNRSRIPHDTMDPASAIIGMASFGFTVFKNVNRVCKDIKNAPEQLRSIEDSCDHVQLLLNQLQVASTGKQSHYDVPYLERLCTRAQRYLEEVDVAINKVTAKQGTEDHRPERRSVRRVKWILKSNDMKDIAQKLDKLQTTLALLVITLRLDNQGPSTTSPPHSPHYNAGIDRDRTSSHQLYSPRSSLHCKTGCECSCHSLSLQSLIPTSLAAYLGQIYVSRRLLSTLWSTYNLCNVSDCHGDLRHAMTVHWILPAGFLSGCLQSSRDPSRRIHFSLCLPRTIPFDSPVLHAIYGTDIERIHTLFSTGQASIWDHDVAGHPIVSHACRQWLRYRAEEQLAIVRFLVEAGSDALLLAGPPGYCLAQDWLILGLLQCLLVDGTTAGRSLAACIQTSSVAVHVFRSILSMDSVDALEDYLSRYGYSEKHLEHLRILLETAECGEARFSMFNAIGYTPLEYAICFAPSSVRALLKEGADATAEPTLAYAAQHGRVDVIEALIDSGADVNMTDESGQTALHWACYRCNYEEFFELVLHAENDIDWNLRTPEGLNALDLFDLSVSDGLASHWTPDEISEFRAVLVTHVDSSEPSVLRNEALDSVFIMMPGAFPTDIA